MISENIPILKNILRVLKQAKAEGHILVPPAAHEFVIDLPTLRTNTDLMGYVVRDPAIMGAFGHKHWVASTMKADVYIALVKELDAVLDNFSLAQSVTDSLLSDDSMIRHSAGIEMHLAEEQITKFTHLWRDDDDLDAAIAYNDMLISWVSVREVKAA